MKIVSKEETESCTSTGEIESATRAKMMDFLHEAAERIIIMNTVYKKVMLRYRSFLEWLGLPPHLHGDYRPHHTCRVVSEFALEFRTTRDRVLQTMQKKKAAREKKRRERAVRIIFPFGLLTVRCIKQCTFFDLMPVLQLLLRGKSFLNTVLSIR